MNQKVISFHTNVLGVKALQKEDQMYQPYKLTKLHLNTVRHSSTYLDTLPKKPVLYGERRKKNAF